MSQQENIFSIVLASTVHDMKNSLGMMSKTLESILSDLRVELGEESNQDYAVLQYEHSRVNNLLMQLLAVYKIDNNQLPFNLGYYNIYDFIEEQLISYLPLFKAKGFDYIIDIDDELEVAFDESLMAMAVSNVIGNTIRYAQSKIIVKVETGEMLKISIYDDGPGYPESMIENTENHVLGVDQTTGSTGLGLFFAQRVAQLHCHGDKVGFIKLSNGGVLGGGIFEISIP